jgi:pimeloyl-ACP methyl ester carboxylesterase
VNFSDVPYRFFSQHLIVDGIRVAYVDVNPERPDPAECGPVLFLHDVAGDLDDFGDAYELASNTRRAIGVDLIGFGKSDKPRLDDAVGANASIVVGLLDALDVERAALVVGGAADPVAPIADAAAGREERHVVV